MAITRTYLTSGTINGTGSLTLTGLNVTSGDLLVIGNGIEGSNGTNINPSISSTNMGTLTWISATSFGGSLFDRATIFYTTVQATTSAGTTTIISTAATQVNIYAEAHKFSNHNGVSTSGSNAINLDAGTLTVTLSASPISTDKTFGFICRNEYTPSPGVITVGTGYNEINNQKLGSGTNKIIVQSQDRTGSTSNTCTWDCTGDDWYTAGAAIVIQEYITPPTPILVRTYLNRGSATGTNDVTLSGLNVTVGDLIVVLAAVQGSNSTALDLTISDANMGTMSWTEVTVGGGNQYDTVSIFYAIVQSTTEVGQVVVSSTGATQVNTFAEAHKFTGHDGVRTSGSYGVDLNAGTLTTTLSASPSATDIVIGICGRSEFVPSPGAVAVGSGYTEIYNAKLGSTNKIIVETEDRTGSTGNTATWVCTGDDWYTAGVAIAVKQSTATTATIFYFERGILRGVGRGILQGI